MFPADFDWVAAEADAVEVPVLPEPPVGVVTPVAVERVVAPVPVAVEATEPVEAVEPVEPAEPVEAVDAVEAAEAEAEETGDSVSCWLVMEEGEKIRLKRNLSRHWGVLNLTQ